eukprot:767269-Hanusia_phi.AAC.2
MRVGREGFCGIELLSLRDPEAHGQPFASPECIPYGLRSLESQGGIGRESVLYLERSSSSIQAFATSACGSSKSSSQLKREASRYRGDRELTRFSPTNICCYSIHFMYLMYLHVPCGDGIRFCPGQCKRYEGSYSISRPCCKIHKEGALKHRGAPSVSQVVLSDAAQHKEDVKEWSLCISTWPNKSQDTRERSHSKPSPACYSSLRRFSMT